MRETGSDRTEAYFRVYDSRGEILANLLPRKAAQRWRRKWNSWAIGRENPCRLVRLTIVEGK